MQQAWSKTTPMSLRRLSGLALALLGAGCASSGSLPIVDVPIVASEPSADVEAVVDEFTAPMPPKVKASQAIKFAESLVRGEPNRTKIALTQMHERVRELV